MHHEHLPRPNLSMQARWSRKRRLLELDIIAKPSITLTKIRTYCNAYAGLLRLIETTRHMIEISYLRREAKNRPGSRSKSLLSIDSIRAYDGLKKIQPICEKSRPREAEYLEWSSKFSSVREKNSTHGSCTGSSVNLCKWCGEKYKGPVEQQLTWCSLCLRHLWPFGLSGYRSEWHGKHWPPLH